MNTIDRIKNAAPVLKRFKKMKTIPSVATKLVSMIESDSNSLQEFEEVIKMDPILVLRLLKMVNSSYFALRTKIKSISEAVAYIGMDNLRNLLILDALKNLFKKKSCSSNFSRSRLWFHSSVTSICCQMISERIFTQKGENAFLCGLLHDIGMVIEDQVLSDQFQHFCSTFEPEIHDFNDYECSIIGTDHPALGYLLIEEWGLGKNVCQAIKKHHKSKIAVEPESLLGILKISEYLIFKLNYIAFPEVQVNLDSQTLLSHVKENIIHYKAIVDDLPHEIQKAKDIYSLEENQNG